jgi:potassium efflux system protein
MLRFLAILVLVTWASPVWTEAQEKGGAPGLVPRILQRQDTDERRQETQSPSAAFPGLAEVVPRSAELAKQAEEAERRIAAAREKALAETRIEEAESRLQRLRGQMEQMGDPGDWDIYRLLDARVLLAKERRELEGFLGAISSRLTDLEAIRKEWEERGAFWSEWRKSLQAAQVEPPSETFGLAEGTSRRVLHGVSETSTLLVGLQQRVLRLIDENRQIGSPIEAALTRLRGETFKKTEPAFLSKNFREQIESFQWPSVLDGLKAALKTAPELAEGQAVILLFQALILLGGALLVSRLGRSAPREKGWQDLVRHPWAFGILAAGVLSTFVLQESTGLWRFVARSVFAFAAVLLVWRSLGDPWRQRLVLMCAAAAALCDLFKVASLPSVLYRVYLALLALAGSGMCILSALKERRDPAHRPVLAVGLWIAALVGAAGLFAQVSGLSNLSDRLISSGIWSVFLGISAVVLLRASELGMDVAIRRTAMSEREVVRQFGQELGKRLTPLVRTMIWGLAVLALFPLWGVFTSTGEAWERLFGFRFALGGISLSPGLVGTAVLVLYVSVLASWVLRTTLEAEVFPRRSMGRGAADAIAKLVHYGIVLVGFLVGVSVLGIDLKSFVVLGGALGIGIGFGLQEVVNNFICGLILLFERPVKVGDMVVVDNESGRVKEIGLRSTIIETFDRSELIVPNSHFITRNVTNWTLTSPMARLKIPIGVAYKSDVDLVLRLLRESAESNPRIVRDPAPLPLFVRFGDNALEFELQVWVSDVKEMLLARSEIGQEIDRRFREAGISIPFPQREVHLHPTEPVPVAAVLGRDVPPQEGSTP